VVGKRGRLRSVPLVPELEEQLNVYLTLRALPSSQVWQEAGLPAVRLLAGTRSTIDAEVSLNPTTVFRDLKVRRDLKEVFRLAAETMVRRGHAEETRVFERASVHWLRHTFGRYAMSMNVRPKVVQTVLGHASLAKTTLYSSAGAGQAYEGVRRFTRGRV
jgi:integrase